MSDQKTAPKASYSAEDSEVLATAIKKHAKGLASINKESMNLISEENRDLYNFDNRQIEGLINSVDDDSPDIKVDDPMGHPSTSGVKTEIDQKNRKRKMSESGGSDYFELKKRHLSVMTSYYEKKTAFIDLKINQIMKKTTQLKKKIIEDSETSSLSE
ncbi:hypothetical protein ACKWTF_008849 [Chironomus riparius]